MFIMLKPFDTLFFRGSRPFSKGEDTWADFIFPPYPSTIYGAIRSYLISKMGKVKDFEEGKFRDILGIPGEPANFTIKGPFIMKEDKPFFKVPHDMVMLKNRKEKAFLLDFVKKPSVFVSDYPLDYGLLCRKKDDVEDSSGWIEYFDFEDYLKGNKKEFNVVENDLLYEIEEKIGIGIERNRKVAEEGYLYKISMVRLKDDVSIGIEIEGLEKFDENGVLKLGGESKAVFFEKVKIDILDGLKNLDLELKEKVFKVYFATPAIFEKGWLPKWLDEKTLEGKFNGIKVKLLACAIGKYLYVGGWDMARRKAKPLKKAVPSGSVYYFKILGDVQADEIKKAFHFKNISDERSEEGFGLSFVGEVIL